MDSLFKVKFSDGSGRAFVVLYEGDSDYAVYADAVSRKLATTTKVLLVEIPVLTDENWKDASSEFLKFIKAQNIRQASYIGFGAANTLVYNTYLREPKIVRTAVVVDGASSPHPSQASRFIDKLEKRFPLGLPLRAGSKGFDVRSHLQRVRCPVLVMTSPEASDYLVHEAHEANRAMPSSWFVQLESADAVGQFCSIVESFQEVPAKCPQ